MAVLQVLKDIILIVVPPLASLLGVFIGAHIANRNEYKKHHADLLIKAYSDFFNALSEHAIHPSQETNRMTLLASANLRFLCSDEIYPLISEYVAVCSNQKHTYVELSALTDKIVEAARKDIDYCD